MPPDVVLRFQPHTLEEAAHPPGLGESGAPGARHVPARPVFRDAVNSIGITGWQEWGPPVRSGHTMVLDTRRQRVYVLGGEFNPHASLWAGDLASGDWAQISTRPEGLVTAAYDSLRDRLLVLSSSSGLHLDAFAPASATWSRLWDGPAIPIVAMAIDTYRDELTLFCPNDPAIVSPEVVRIPLAAPGTWHAEPLASAYPLAIGGRGSAVYEPAHDCFDVIWANVDGYPAVPGGGRIQIVTAGDAPVASPHPMPAYVFGSMREVAYDALRDRLLIVHSEGPAVAISNDGGSVWRLDDGLQAFADNGLAACFDPVSRRIIGGMGQRDSEQLPLFAALSVDSGAVWTMFDARRSSTPWRELTPGGLGSRIWHRSIVDPQTHRLIVFGGYVSGGVRDLVVAHPISAHGGWTALGTGSASVPRARFGEQLGYDPLHHALILYGGQAIDGTGDLLGDMWSLSLAPGGQWTPLTPASPGPGNLRNASLAYDAPRQRFILLGGDDLQTPLLSAWELKLDGAPTWRALTLAGDLVAPYAALFTDPLRGDGWSYSGASPLATFCHLVFGPDTIRATAIATRGPIPEMNGNLVSMTFDATHRRMLAFYTGSVQSMNGDLGTLWSTPLGDSATWSSQPIPGGGLESRYLVSNAFDDASGQLLLTGGYYDNTRYFGDAWQLGFTEPTAVQVSLASATADSRGAHLRWYVPSGDAVGQAERSSDGNVWQALGAADRSGTDAMTYDDATLAAGARAAYRLRITAGAQVTYTSAAWLSGVGSAGLALSAMPHGPGAPAAVRFTLAAGIDARLKLFDVSGRMRASVALAPAMQAWTFRESLEPGLYVAELTQGGARRTARVIALR